MFRFRSTLTVFALGICVVIGGCRATSNPFSSGGGQNGNSSVVLAMTDTPPSLVSILSAKVTLTGATLSPGNVSLLSAPATLELTRLQTDIAYLATATNIPAGTYTSVVLTFANPLLTIENDTSAAIGTCAVGTICTIAPTSTPILSATIPLTSFAIASNSTTGLLMDVNLDNVLTAALGADFSAGTTVTPFTPAGSGAPLVGSEDVVGQVGATASSSSTFTFSNLLGSYTLKVDNTTTFFQFPSNVCTTGGFACLRANQILSVDIAVQSDGTLLARNVLFEDADNSDTEVEGMITGTNVGSQQFNIATLAESASISGLQIGDMATVHYAVAPLTPFDVDFAHADNAQVSTAGFIFAAPTDLAVGQQVSIRRNSGSSGSSITADRIRLRSTRITATVQTIGAPNLFLYNIPSIFSGHGVTQVEAQTSPPTILAENGVAIPFTQIPVSGVVSVRGPLFNVSGTRTLIASKVALKP